MTKTHRIESIDAYIQAHGIQTEADNTITAIEQQKRLLGGRMVHTIAHAYDLRQQNRGLLRSLTTPREIRSPHVFMPADELEQGQQVAAWLQSPGLAEGVELRTAVVDDTHKLETESQLVARADGRGSLNFSYGAGIIAATVELELVQANIQTVGNIFNAIDGHFALA